MPSTQSRPVVVLLALTACLCIVAVAVPVVAGGFAAAGAATGPSVSGQPAASTGCFPGVDAVERDEAVGDVVEIEMLLCFEGSVTVDGPGFRATANLSGGDKSGQVTLRLNTHLEDAAAVNATSDTFELQTDVSGNGSFAPGNYTVTVRDGSDDVRDEVSFELGEPRARDLRLWRAPRGAASDLRGGESVERSREAVARVDSRRRLEDPDYSDSLNVATNETLVVAIEADGLEGAMAAAEGSPLARFRTAIRATNAAFEVGQTQETVTTQRQALKPDALNSSATHLVAQPENDTYYLVIDTSRLWGEWEGTMGGPVHIGSSLGMGFAYRFSMEGGDLENDPPRDLQSADHLMVEPLAAFPRAREERVTLAPEAAQELVVATTVAPGTEITVNVSGGINRTLTRTVRPQNRTVPPGFVVPLDLSGVPNGTRFTVEFGDTVTDQRDTDGLRVVVRRPEASLQVRDDPMTSQSLVLSSVQVSHRSIVAVYAGDGSLVGTQPVESGLSVGVFVPLSFEYSEQSTYRVVLYRDADRSRTLSEADERYRVGGMPVSTTVDPDTDGAKTETPTVSVEPTQPPETVTPTTEPETPTTRPGPPSTEVSTPGFGVVATIVALAGSLLLGRRKP